MVPQTSCLLNVIHLWTIKAISLTGGRCSEYTLGREFVSKYFILEDYWSISSSQVTNSDLNAVVDVEPIDCTQYRLLECRFHINT